jgi:hypothetical protein
MSHNFQEEYLLRNIGKVILKETVGDALADRPADEAPPDPAQVRRSANFVELKIKDPQVPAQDDAGKDVPGLSLFVYDALPAPEVRGGASPGKWFIESLARVPTIEKGEPGGITLPMWAFRNRGPLGLAFADRLFDETTKVPVETRFEVSAVCVTRIHYSAMSDPASTEKVLTHERKHFNGIRRAWAEATGSLRQSMQELATTLNDSLGGLSGAEAFTLKEEDLREVWKIDPNEPQLSAIPEGPLRPATGGNDLVNRANRIHTNRKVSYLRLRLVRRLPAESGARTLVEMLTSKEEIDPLFKRADEIVGQWKLNHWRNNASNEFRRAFIQQFQLAAWNLDKAEGTIDKNGQQSGRTDLDRVIAKFRALLARKPNDDPLVLARQAAE